jgi:hypothetical protein
MFADISHLNKESLTGCTKMEMVLSDDVTNTDKHGQVESLQPCVNRSRLLCAKNLELCCGLVGQLETDCMFMEDVPEIPTDIAVACLLNPLLVGGKSHSLSLWLLLLWHFVVVIAVFANFVCLIVALIFQVKRDY